MPAYLFTCGIMEESSIEGQIETDAQNSGFRMNNQEHSTECNTCCHITGKLSWHASPSTLVTDKQRIPHYFFILFLSPPHIACGQLLQCATAFVVRS